MPVLTVALFCISGMLGLFLAALITSRRGSGGSFAVYGLALALSVIILALALHHMITDAQPLLLTLPLGLPWIGMHFKLDALAAFFLVIVNLGGAAASLYALGYGRHEDHPLRVLPFFPPFLAGMNLVLLADDAFTFLFFWEVMSLASWALVVAHHHLRDNTRAAYVYLVMASLGTFLLLLAFGLLAGAGGQYTFSEMQGATRPEWVQALVLTLVLLGAGSKAGLVPVHAWLPLAHPAAPSHVSALMSGVMTKVAVYAVIRIVFSLLGAPAWWWGLAVIIVGAATAVLGVLYALMQNDIKRILAYSTIENIGFVFVGLGLSLAFRSEGMNLASALAMTAALMHCFNHSLFKSLLFFVAGAVLQATGERDIDKMGGLMHRMPVTGILFLLGSVAISALPPLNGFVSEWLTLQALFLSPELPQWGLKILIPAAGCLLALAAALAAACFIRAFGISFLGRARSGAVMAAQEVNRPMLAAMSILAGLCILAGIFPGLIIDGLASAVLSVTDARIHTQHTVPWLSIVPAADSHSSYNGLLIMLFILISAAGAAYTAKLMGHGGSRRTDAWDCGFPDPRPITQYTANSFAQPIRRIFGTVIFRARESVRMPPPGDMAPAHMRVELHDLIWDYLSLPAKIFVFGVAGWINPVQYLSIRRYIGVVFLSLVLLLLVLTLWF